MSKLTAKQEKFAQLYVEYGDASKAYRETYSTKAKPEVVHVKAAEVLRNGKVTVRVGELQAIAKAQAEKVFEITVEQKQRYLLQVIEAGLERDDRDKPINLTAVTGAISELNKMSGDHAAIKTENKVSMSHEDALELLK